MKRKNKDKDKPVFESKYALKKRQGNRMYGDCRTGGEIAQGEIARAKEDARRDPGHNYGATTRKPKEEPSQW